MIRVLIVDDSAFMRNALSNLLSSDPEITVVGTAKDGLEGVELAAALNPDVVTLDVEMPKLDGIAALRRIMKEKPVPVIMVSSLTTEGARLTMEALEIGAMDFIPKNLSDRTSNILSMKDSLISKVKAVSRGVSAPKPQIEKHAPEKRSAVSHVDVIAIGASTGGPRALQTIIPRLPGGVPVPILIAQHMPEGFTRAFADRLAQMSRIMVKEAEDGEFLKPGIVYVAPGSGHMSVARTSGLKTCLKISQGGDETYRPSIDQLFSSVADQYAADSLGIILTGMGADGLKGATRMKGAGARVIAQDERTSAVFGMPRAALEAGVAERAVPLDEMSDEIMRAIGMK